MNLRDWTVLFDCLTRAELKELSLIDSIIIDRGVELRIAQAQAEALAKQQKAKKKKKRSYGRYTPEILAKAKRLSKDGVNNYDIARACNVPVGSSYYMIKKAKEKTNTSKL